MHLLHTLTTTYLTELRNQRSQANSTDELSYRDFLGKFLRGAVGALGRTASFTGEAKKITFGRPDYEVTHSLKVIGYVEAEALGTPLGQLKGSAKAQNERFRSNLHNFLLTNHTEFRLFLDGREAVAALLPEPPEHGAVKVSDAALDALQTLLETFLDTATPAAATPEAIARQLARRARFLRVAADAMLSHDDSPLHLLWNLYKVTLFDGLSAEKFADVYAQTFTYGLFLAWLNTDKKPFDRTTALRAIPRAVPPIRVLLQFGGGDDLPEEFHWIVDGICSDLDAADKESATKHSAGIADPLIHFYETFLGAYDPDLRKQAGVYYTPDAVVNFLVRAVDSILRHDFDKNDGLADESVRLLDPATGTATFLACAYRHVYQTMLENGDGGVWPDRARTHLARHFYGFERLPAAYTLAHVKLRQQMAELGVALGDNERLPIYLADTMMSHVPVQLNFPWADVLSKETQSAREVRDQEQILVVLGNPPYLGKSAIPEKDAEGKLTFIGEKMQDYYKVDGIHLNEAQSRWLRNDYVKFIRFAQWRIERSDAGIVAFITDNSYLDNPTFRGMRRSLMQTFDEIFVYNLHGCTKPKEYGPGGTEDRNVFDVQQGVALSLFVKRTEAGQRKKGQTATIHYADLYGSRKYKYDSLHALQMSDVDWRDLSPNSPSYLFMPQDQANRVEYESSSWSITEVFRENSVGIVSGCDPLTIHMTKAEAVAACSELPKLSVDLIRQKYKVKKDTKDAAVKLVTDDLQGRKISDAQIDAVVYRPFDLRFTYFSGKPGGFLRRPQKRVMGNMLSGANVGIGTTRSVETAGGFEHVFVSSNLFTHHSVSVKEVNHFFPLWLYPTEEEATMGIEREANLSQEFVSEVAERISEVPTSEDIFCYAYAILHAPSYRIRYAAFLKADFPRLPLPPDAETFHLLATLGARLIALHLLKDPALQKHGIVFDTPGSHIVKKMRAAERYILPTPDKSGRVKLNDTEYFDNVPPEAWVFRVGGSQPAAKWLEDRAGRALTADDITHYRRMIAAMRETAALLPQVDAAFLELLAKNTDPAAEGQDAE